MCQQRWNLRERRPALSDASLEGSELEMSAETTPLNMPRKRKAVEQQKVRREPFRLLPQAVLTVLPQTPAAKRKPQKPSAGETRVVDGGEDGLFDAVVAGKSALQVCVVQYVCVDLCREGHCQLLLVSCAVTGQ